MPRIIPNVGKWSSRHQFGLIVLMVLAVVVGYTAVKSFAAGKVVNGLSATYYDNMDFSGATVSRVDPNIDFNLIVDHASPAAGIDTKTWSARWTGVLTAPSTGTFQFSTVSDDGARIWVDNQLIVNTWTTHSPLTDAGSIRLIKGAQYAIKVEYYQKGGGAQLKAMWRLPGTTTAVTIPSSALSTTIGTDATPTPKPTATPAPTPTPKPTTVPTPTPTATPSATPAPGSGSTSCALPKYPSASCTGVPAGTVLSAYTGPCQITTAGTVIDAKTANCDLDIRAANVTIKRSKVNGLVILDTDLAGSSAWSFTLVDSEVDASTQQRAAVSTGNMTVLRSNIHGGVTAAQCEEKSVSCTITDSYLHGQYIKPNSNWHLGGFLSDGGGPITLRHNFVTCDQQAVYGSDGGCTGDINLIPNFGTAHNVTIDSNLLGANTHSAFCTYGGERSDGAYPHGNHIVYTNNIFQRGTNKLCAAYGAVNAFNSSGTGNVWTNNKWDDGTTLPPAN